MLDLDDVISKVGRIELSADTRQQHLARLLALQVSPAQICRIGPQAEASVGRRRPRAGLAGGLAAAAVVVVAGTSALLVPALQAPQIAPGAPGAVSTPAPSHSSAPTSRSAAPTTGSDAPTVPDAAFSKQLAGILGLTDAQATAVTAQLNNLGRHGGADPTSTQFIHIARKCGSRAGPAGCRHRSDQEGPTRRHHVDRPGPIQERRYQTCRLPFRAHNRNGTGDGQEHRPELRSGSAEHGPKHQPARLHPPTQPAEGRRAGQPAHSIRTRRGTGPPIQQLPDRRPQLRIHRRATRQCNQPDQEGRRQLTACEPSETTSLRQPMVGMGTLGFESSTTCPSAGPTRRRSTARVDPVAILTP